MKPYTYEAAWVPYRKGRPFSDAAIIAMQWAEKTAATRSAPAILFTDTKSNYRGEEPFDLYADRHFTCRSEPGLRPGAVIAHVPTPDALDRAIRIADGNALVVVEHPSPRRVLGWARAVGALDLTTGEHADPLPDSLRTHLDDLLIAGNNGYHDKPGHRDAKRILTEMHGDGSLDGDLVLTALAAMGISPSGLKELETIIGRLGPYAEEPFTPNLDW